MGEDDCRGHLWACQGDDAQNRVECTAHYPFRSIWEKEPGAQVVTLLREPVEHLFSVVAWEHRRVSLKDFTATAPRICTSMVWGFLKFCLPQVKIAKYKVVDNRLLMNAFWFHEPPAELLLNMKTPTDSYKSTPPHTRHSSSLRHGEGATSIRQRLHGDAVWSKGHQQKANHG